MLVSVVVITFMLSPKFKGFLFYTVWKRVKRSLIDLAKAIQKEACTEIYIYMVRQQSNDFRIMISILFNLSFVQEISPYLKRTKTDTGKLVKY